MSAGISIREFARRDGCNEKLVRRAIQSGRLATLSDGTLNSALCGTGWRKTNRRADKAADMSAGEIVRGKVSATTPGAPAKRRRTRPGTPEPAIEASVEPTVPEDESDLDGFIGRLLAGRFGTIAEAERMKENGLALKHVLAARREAGGLIELDLAEAVVFEVFRTLRDAWLNWPVRVGPLVAAELGLEADRLTEVLTAHVHQHISELGEPGADFSGQG